MARPIDTFEVALDEFSFFVDAWCAAPTAEPTKPRYGVKSWGEMHRLIPTAAERDRTAKPRKALAHRKAVKKHKAAMRRAGKQ